MLRDKQRIIKNYIIFSSLLLVTEAGIVRFIMIPRLGLFLPLLYNFSNMLFSIGFMVLLIYSIYSFFANKFYKGIKYGLSYTRIMYKMRKSLKDAGYYVEENFRGERVAIIPKIEISFSKDFTFGKVTVENHIKLDKRLENVDISSALGRYIVLEQYIDDNANKYIYEFEDSKIDRQLMFNSYDDFKKYVKRIQDYMLFTDSKVRVPVSSLLLVGSTGSGKTYALYTLILTLLNWKVKPQLYFADPKNSSLIVLGKAISVEHTAGTVEEIIILLERFHDEMQVRKLALQEKLYKKLDADYKHWNMSANVFIFDEFASFQSVINGMDKKTRDHVAMLLRNIVLQGRQLGYFLWIVMQKSDASDIPTSIRDNLIWKVVLGNATRTTYVTAFEESANLPIRNFSCGKGLYSYQGITRQPQITSFPTLNFDILSSVKQ